ncbi:MAG: PD40 domain-containing protein [Balneolaceae bacterium]|nr:PD40 domain-containing protein [Balneolaceae bacterium]MBO6544992.1 PD40 domain-containing protein [Balneolaceae bacterium]MBO6646388.1 PD40 domain-containing protein [Balneolaceae bacterium]
MSFKRIFTSALFSFFLIASGYSQNPRFTTAPSISPDASTIVFSYESDLWKVPAEGGTAVRLTGMDGHESFPNISPDGKWLAFSSDQYGNNDVYIMPIAGGQITQLTFHQSSDVVSSWNWDSKTLYFTSNRYNRTSTYSISVDGGTPKRLFDHYHNNVHNLVKHPSRNEFYFNESWESFIFPQRKGYKGAFNPDIKSYNTNTETYAEHTSWEGKDLWPTLDQSGNLYFVSDEFNGEYNLYQLNNGEKERLTSFTTSVKYPKVSANGQTIVFEKEYQIYTYDIASGESRLVPISIFRNNTLTKSQSFEVSGNVTGLDVSPDGKKMAFISRGELFVSDMDGKFIRQINTSGMGRVLEVKWLNDNKTLLFNQTVNGYQNLFTVSADGSGKEEQHTSDDQNNRNIEVSSDRSKAVYHSGRDELRIIDLESFESETVVKDEFWGFQNTQPYFSPNDEYLLYNAKRDFEQDIFVYHIESKEIQNLTRTGVSELAPFWAPDGKYIYYSTTQTTPTYPRGSNNFDVFRLPLDRFEEPFKSQKFDQLFEEADESDENIEESEEKLEITINTDRIMERAEPVGERFGNQFVSVVLQDGDKTMVLYTSNHDEGNTALYVTTHQPFEQPKTSKIEGISQVRFVTVSEGKVYAIGRGSIYKIDTASAKATKIETEDSFQRNLKDEFYQMFDEFWANMEENFYNETFHGVDWEKIRDRYKTYLPYVTNRSDLRRMNNDMLGELNSSHLGFNSNGAEENEFHSTTSLSVGLLFENDNPFTVASIVQRGPLDIPGKNIQAGDELVAVEGVVIDKNRNRESYFSFPTMQEELTLTFKRGRDTFDMNVHPVSYFSTRTDLYDEWVDTNQRMVDEQTDKRVAYVHMKNMGGGQLQSFLLEMTSEAYNRDALILDLRYNTGGNVHDDVLRFLSQRKYAQWKYREGKMTGQSNFNPADKPIILMINEQTLSDAEVTTAGFKELGLGTVVGTETYRWIIFTSGKSLVDGSFYRLPKVGVYSLDGANLERTGVAPDIEVHNNFKDRLEGNDPQLTKAIELALEQLKE